MLSNPGQEASRSSFWENNTPLSLVFRRRESHVTPVCDCGVPNGCVNTRSDLRRSPEMELEPVPVAPQNSGEVIYRLTSASPRGKIAPR